MVQPQEMSYERIPLYATVRPGSLNRIFGIVKKFGKNSKNVAARANSIWDGGIRGNPQPC
jgi:hypothetical protein